MPSLAKQAVRTSFIKLLNQRPLSEITVRDIVEDCGVNRNTFYYHFRDIPQLLESIISEEGERLIREYPQIDSMEQCLEAVIGFSLANRNVVLHIYHSVNRDIYEQYQWRICRHAVETYLRGALAGRSISEKDYEILVDYLKCLCFGVVIDWLETGMKSDIKPRLHRIFALKQGHYEEMLTRCEAT